ncbi:MAG: class I SAM-dependent methyltransferase [Sinobacteraceae bacterium]|nr:class I SAM-dependent methyltransferase [Nevskiaceae bacterium]
MTLPANADLPARGGCYIAATMRTNAPFDQGSENQAAQTLLDENRRFYDGLWSGSRLVQPERFNTWPLVQSLLPESDARLEVAPGLRPRLPIHGTHFVDISAPALRRLQDEGGVVSLGEVTALPFADGSFDLVCALDIIEHVDDEDAALSEISRVARTDAALLISTPLHPTRWTAFDDFVGHRRRYEPQRLLDKLGEHHLRVESSAVFGMQPRSSLLLDLGVWFMTHQRERAMWWYNRAFMPLGLRFQKSLHMQPGMLPAADVDEVLLLCRCARS